MELIPFALVIITLLLRMSENKIDIISIEDVNRNNNRITSKFMTKYEKTRILGTRATQISMNAPAMVDTTGITDPLKIAIKEFEYKNIYYYIILTFLIL